MEFYLHQFFWIRIFFPKKRRWNDHVIFMETDSFIFNYTGSTLKRFQVFKPEVQLKKLGGVPSWKKTKEREGDGGLKKNYIRAKVGGISQIFWLVGFLASRLKYSETKNCQNLNFGDGETFWLLIWWQHFEPWRFWTLAWWAWILISALLQDTLNGCFI